GAERDVSGNPIASNWDAKPGHRPAEDLGGESPLPPGSEDDLADLADLADLVDTAERLVGDPVAAWRANQGELERRRLRHQEWGQTGTRRSADEQVEPGRPALSTGGAMS